MTPENAIVPAAKAAIVPVQDIRELTTDDIDHRDYLHWMCMEGYARWVLDGIKDDAAKQAEYMERLKYELDVIEEMGFIDYFLIVQDYVNYARDHGMPTGPGRGSAAGSLVSYLAGITRVDPIRFGLYFERFLNPDRIGMPDIDVDFPQSKRQEIMDYVRERYGTDRAAQVMTFGYERPKGSIKDMARVLGYPPMLADKITKSISEDLKATIESELALGGDFTRMYATDPDVRRIVDVAKRVEGLVRGDSIHASAFVVAPWAIADHMPMQTPKGQQGKLSADDTASFIIQFDGTTVEKLGYLKFDFLGLGNLDAISNTQRLIKKVYGIDIELEDVPFDDKKTLSLLRRGETAGLFQLESEGMVKTLKQVMPTKFSEISDIIALYRPGPMEYIPVYVEGKRDPESIQYLDPRLKDILEDTYGVACIAEGSRIAVADGFKPIEDVEPGEMVLTEDGTYQKCLARWNNGVKPTVVVRTDFGEELRCTADHKVLTDDGWVEAGQLQKNQGIRAFSPFAATRSVEAFDWKEWLVGLFVADGNSGTSSPTIACGSENMANRIADVARQCFPTMQGISVRSQSNGVGTTWYVTLAQVSGKRNGYFSADYEPNPFNELLREKGLYKQTGEDKCWPARYTFSTIVGFIEGDGCYQNRRINLKHRHLAESVHHALLEYGIWSSVYDRDVNSWSVAFGMVPELMPRLRDYDGREARNVFAPSHDSPARARVLSVSEGPELRVYDLSVETNHSFVVGGLVVSNCYQEQLMEIAKSLAGFSMADADWLRKAIGKKLMDVMDSLKEKFADGCRNNPDGALSEDQIESLWALMEAAGNYSFNKCLSGSTVVTRAAAGRYDASPDISIARLYENWHSKTAVGAKYRDAKRGIKILSLDGDGRIRPRRVLGVYEQGMQQLLLVTTASGRTLRCTANHVSLTDRGWLRADEMATGDDLGVNLGYEYVQHDYRTSPVSEHRLLELSSKASTKGLRGFQDGSLNPGYIDGNFAKLKAWQSSTPNVCSVDASHGGRIETHHKDRDRTNNEPENLEKLCVSCHKKADYAGGRRRRWEKGHQAGWDTIISIEPAGEEMTYDIEMEADPGGNDGNVGGHNFIANGIVTHNSHSVAYAFLAWYTAYFKANYPAEFMCSMMSYRKDHPKAADFLSAFFRDCHRYDVAVLPPHVNRSGIDFDVAKPMEISFGLSALKGIGDGPAGFIVAERERNGGYGDFNDFLSRMDSSKVNAGVIEKLAKAGALDGMGWTRQAFVEEFERIKDFVKKMRSGSKHSEDQPTFDFFDELELATIEPTITYEYGPDELLEMEKENLGFYLTGNPLEYYELSRRMKAKSVPAKRLFNLSDLDSLNDQDEVWAFGSVARLKRHQTQKGDFMAFVTLQDFGAAQESVHGYSPTLYTYDVVIFPRSYDEWGHRLREGDFACIHGKIKDNPERGSRSLAADDASMLPKDSKLGFDDDAAMRGIAEAMKAEMARDYEVWSKPAADGTYSLEITMPAASAADFLAIVDKYPGDTPAVLIVDGRRKDLGTIDYNKRFKTLMELVDARVRMVHDGH